MRLELPKFASLIPTETGQESKTSQPQTSFIAKSETMFQKSENAQYYRTGMPRYFLVSRASELLKSPD